jgi:hypothetical protein
MSPLKTLARAVPALLLCVCVFAQAQDAVLRTTAAAGPGIASAKALVLNDAQFVSQSVPTSMAPDGVYNVSVSMKNTGSGTWSPAANYLLGSQDPLDNRRWGGARAALGGPVPPGGLGTFSFQVTAPPTAGTYAFQWRMVQEYVAWFGPQTPNVTVAVAGAPPRNDAQVTAQSAPAKMTTGQSYNVSVTMKNIGTTTWSAGASYMLGAQNPQDNRLWNGARVALGATVAPGQQFTFSFPVTAPVPGVYSMQWKMLREGVEWFGGTSTSPVTAVAGTQVPQPTLTVSRTPSPMIAGQPFTLTWTSTDATSLTRLCSATAPGYTINDSPATSGKNTATAGSAWVGHPSTCNWKASGPGGTAQSTETMSTEAAGGHIVTYIHTDGLGSP